ncbi:TIGR02391 family protein [Rhodococcus opacus]|uniref:TIGR02391 family protein n=1 Tax=Rhodococcus opacus TaxID=37919 RepID=UPI00046C9271|nr:TIGR02391 family protein [Rhodococcus opacus]UDH01744.1 TIGR02391 family protein [Rhodococcus opacus PD630]
MTTVISPFPLGTVEAVSRIVGDLYSGSELTVICAEVPLRDDPGEGQTKWRRLAHAISSHQAKTQNGNALVKLVTVAMRPDRTMSRKVRADVARDQLTQVLSLTGMKVREDGRVGTATAASTDSEALNRTQHLRNLLVQRDAHEAVLVYCRSELLRTDFYEAVFESIKGLGSRIRQLTRTEGDGYGLIDATMCGKEPILAINGLSTRTDRDEQTGVANLAKGLFSAFRNPVAHEPRLEWQMSEQDALDVLGTLSLIHRRIDGATVRTDSAL